MTQALELTFCTAELGSWEDAFAQAAATTAAVLRVKWGPPLVDSRWDLSLEVSYSSSLFSSSLWSNEWRPSFVVGTCACRVREGSEARNWYESGTLGSAIAKTDKQPSSVPITTHRLKWNRKIEWNTTTQQKDHHCWSLFYPSVVVWIAVNSAGNR